MGIISKIILSLMVCSKYLYSTWKQMYDLKINQKRANPANKLYSQEMNIRMNSFLRTHDFPKSLFAFAESVQMDNILPSRSRRLVNLLSKNNFAIGDKWIETLKAEALSEEPNLSVKPTNMFVS